MTDDTTSRPRPIARRLRFEILRRDNHQCRYCGATAPEAKLTIDHVVPRALGGSDDPTNLVTACVSCNGGKTSVAPDQATVADVSASQFAWQSALEEASRLARDERTPKPDPTVDQFRQVWGTWEHHGNPVPLPDEWRSSVTVFARNGLDVSDFEHYVGISMRKSDVKVNDKFRYFAGCCWNEINRRTEMARKIIATAPAPTPEPVAPTTPTPWAVVDGEALYTRPGCSCCAGGGYVLDDDGTNLGECWCVSNIPYEVHH